MWGKVEYPIWRCQNCRRFTHGSVAEPKSCPCGSPQWASHTVAIYPNDADDYGQLWLPRWRHFLHPDMTIWHYDAWVMGDSLKGLDGNLALYSPVDHSPLPPPLKDALEGQKKIIAMSHFAEKEFTRADLKPFMYIPHAVETAFFHPGDRREARRRLKLPEDCFLVAAVCTNKGPRKNLGNLLRAFRIFLDREPRAWLDAFLYLHTQVYRSKDNPTGYVLPEIWQGLGIAERIKYVHSVYYEAYGFTEEEMADLYRAADITALVSLGEGFGLPLIESLGCGTPVIYGNYSSMPEVVGPGGLPVEASDRMPFELSSSFQWVPSTEQIASRLLEAYQDWRDGSKQLERMGREGHAHVLRNYTWEETLPSWLKLIAPEGKPEEVVLKARSSPVPGEVDIIIPTWEGLAHRVLNRCLDGLYTHTKVPFHLVIIDDQSTDGSREYLEQLWRERDNVTYLRPERKARGGSQVLNWGLRHCRNRFLVSLNNDVLVLQGWLEEALRCMEDPKVGIVGFKMLYPNDIIQHAGGTFIKGIHPNHIGLGELREAHSEVVPALWVSGPCVLVRREAMGEGWDEDYDTFGGHEDIDMCLTMRNHGWKVIYCGKAEVYHLEGTTVTGMPHFWEMHNRARQIFTSKWVGSKLLKPESIK